VETLTILDEAASLVDGDRGDAYGHPAIDFDKVTAAAQALGIDPAVEGALHHALYMILVKISRLTETPKHRDSIVDIAGYARTYEKVLEFDKEAMEIASDG
jgi:23S rRNA maturation-related 3'-5' exoribonuclease YhaM